MMLHYGQCLSYNISEAQHTTVQTTTVDVISSPTIESVGANRTVYDEIQTETTTTTSEEVSNAPRTMPAEMPYSGYCGSWYLHAKSCSRQRCIRNFSLW